MCLIFLVKNAHPEHPLILAANRDEFYQRPTAAMHWWPGQDILAGRDLEAGGSWLALNRRGQLAAVTNFRELPRQPGQTSRGQIPVAFVQDALDGEDFLSRLLQHDSYAGVNIIAGSLVDNDWYYASNRSPGILPIGDGIHGLSNGLLNSRWPKICNARPVIEQLLQQAFTPELWFALLADTTRPDDRQLPDTGVGLDTERLLSSRFIAGDRYGTRSSTLVVTDRQGRVNVFERCFDAQANITGTGHFCLTPD